MPILSPTTTERPRRHHLLYLTHHRLAVLEAEGRLFVFARFKDGAYATWAETGVDAYSSFDITFVAG